MLTVVTTVVVFRFPVFVAVVYVGIEAVVCVLVGLKVMDVIVIG